jgi:hypothetical protein
MNEPTARSATAIGQHYANAELEKLLIPSQGKLTGLKQKWQ